MDDTNLQGQLLQSRGDLAAAEANLQKVIGGNRQQAVAQANAKLQDSEFALRLAEDDLQRNQSSNREGAISKQAYDTALTTYEIMNLLTELNWQGTTIAIVTHDASVAE